MKNRFFNVAVVVLFTAVLAVMGYIESLRIDISGGSLLLDVPSSYLTEVHTSKAVREKEILKGKVLFERAEIASDIEKMVDELPNGVLKMLSSYTFLVTDKDIVDVYHIVNPMQMFSNFNSFKAVVIYDKELIVLSADNLAYRDSLYHEIAHVIDYSMGLFSKSEEFQRIYSNEVEAFKENISNYAYTRTESGINYYKAEWFSIVDSPEEYFAESFNSYYLHRDILENSCPETYAYIENIIERL